MLLCGLFDIEEHENFEINHISQFLTLHLIFLTLCPTTICQRCASKVASSYDALCFLLTRPS